MNCPKSPCAENEPELFPAEMSDAETLRLAAELLEAGLKPAFTPWPSYSAEIYNALYTLEDIDYLANYDRLGETPAEAMTLEQLATMYTFILRGERFCDGHIASYMEDGTLLRLFRRHLALLEQDEASEEK